MKTTTFITKNNFREMIAIYGYDYVVERIGMTRIQQFARTLLTPIIEEFALCEKAGIDATGFVDFFESEEGHTLALLAGLNGSNGLIEVAYRAADLAGRQ